MSEEAMGLDGGIFSVGIGEQPPSRRGLLRRAQQPPGRQSSGRTARPARATGLPCAAAPLSFLPQRQQRGPCMADNIQARAFAHGDIRIRAVHRDDHGQWLPLWHAYNVFYGRPWEQKDEPPVAPEVTAATWGRFFDDGEPLWALVAERDGMLVGFTHYLFHRNTNMTIGRASCRERVCHTCRSRWSPSH